MKSLKIIFLVFIALASILIGVTYALKKSPSATGAEVDWRILGLLDYVTNEVPAELNAFNEQDVRIPGFVVPLEDNSKMITEFLLVPTPQACIHVPPPPPNQMVLVKMDKGFDASQAYGPVWVYGKLHIGKAQHMYGESSFHLSGTFVEKYK